MADKTIGDLTSKAVADAADLFEIEASGNSRRVAASVLGVASGASFPGSPASGDRFYRTDRNIEYFYDGTRWLSTQIHSASLGRQDIFGLTVTTVDGRAVANVFSGLYSVFVEDVVFEYFQTAAGNWTYNFETVDGATRTTIATTTQSTASAHTAVRVACNTLAASTVEYFNLSLVENSGTATVYPLVAFTYRLVG